MDDSISRQSAIEKVRKCKVIEVTPAYMLIDKAEVMTELMTLPSAQPEIIRCKDCKHRYVDGDRVRYNVCELNHNRAQSDEWFCADAERKEGNK